MYPVTFASARPARVTPSPAAVRADAVLELRQLVLGEHARILRLFAAIDDLARPEPAGPGGAALSGVWHRLADLLDAHTEAEEEICYRVVFGRGGHVAALVNTAIADHDDIRAAMAEARLAEVGSARWWRSVAAARRGCAKHFASEEQGLLAAVCARLTPQASKLLARQWDMFAAARRAQPHDARRPPDAGSVLLSG
jgi:hypothetical protein